MAVCFVVSTKKKMLTWKFQGKKDAMECNVP